MLMEVQASMTVVLCLVVAAVTVVEKKWCLLSVLEFKGAVSDTPLFLFTSGDAIN